MIEQLSNDDIGAADVDALSSAAKKLLAAAGRQSGPLFAAVDGAQYGDLPNQLKLQELEGRSLYLEHADKAIEAASGWLVPLNGVDDLARLLEMSGESCGSIVLWVCPLGETALHRHLRTLNVIQIPASAIPGNDAKADTDQPGESYENVLFRHYDPNVLASLLPLLDESQFARFFGPATHVLVHAEDFGGLRIAARPDDLSIAPRGPLRINPDQIGELEAVRDDASQRRIAGYLREVAPDEASRLSDGQLADFVATNKQDGRELGMRSELALGYWAYLNLGSDGRVSASPVARDYLMNCPEDGSADQKMYALMNRLSKTPQR